MIDTKIRKLAKGRKYSVQLSTCMQMNLNLYVEPIFGCPKTYESERKKFYFTKPELDELVVKALAYAQVMRGDVLKLMACETAKMTYRDMHEAVTNELAPDYISDNFYTADEDLVFLYGQLQILYDFVFEVRCLD